jgi:MFS superfamily sulfate permease-like transporter
MGNDFGTAHGEPCLTVERGPDWLFVRFDGSQEPARGRVAETIWGMLRENMTNRVVLEMESVDSVDDHLLDEISQLGRRVRAEGGIIRICGLSDENLSRLRASPASDHVPHFRCRTDAVRAARAAVS